MRPSQKCIARGDARARCPFQNGFQISQRADFFSELVSIDTMNRRPLINTRDEPHADPSRFRRFHVIVGDSNLSQFATWLKIAKDAGVQPEE